MEQYSILDLALEVYIPGGHRLRVPRGPVRLHSHQRPGAPGRGQGQALARPDAAPKVNKKRLQRVAMCFAADHPEVEAISFDVLEVIVGSEATLTFNAAKAAFTWER